MNYTGLNQWTIIQKLPRPFTRKFEFEAKFETILSWKKCDFIPSNACESALRKWLIIVTLLTGL